MADSKQDKKRDDVLRRMLKTPPKPHEPKKDERKRNERRES